MPLSPLIRYPAQVVSLICCICRTGESPKTRVKKSAPQLEVVHIGERVVDRSITIAIATQQPLIRN